MKKYILFLLMFLSYITLLNAQESIKVHVNALCCESQNIVSSLNIRIDSNKLDLSEDAVQDNLGGYVDIPEDKYYLKTQTDVYYIDGVVQADYENSVNQFTSSINNKSGKLITIEELYNLKDRNDLRLIQKINLEQNHSRDKTTTNILNISFDSTLFTTEYEKCEKQVIQPQKSNYLLIFFAVFFILLLLYLLKKRLF